MKYKISSESKNFGFLRYEEHKLTIFVPIFTDPMTKNLLEKVSAIIVLTCRKRPVGVVSLIKQKKSAMHELSLALSIANITKKEICQKV